jgi:hypothetical protein
MCCKHFLLILHKKEVFLFSQQMNSAHNVEELSPPPKTFWYDLALFNAASYLFTGHWHSFLFFSMHFEL